MDNLVHRNFRTIYNYHHKYQTSQENFHKVEVDSNNNHPKHSLHEYQPKYLHMKDKSFYHEVQANHNQFVFCLRKKENCFRLQAKLDSWKHL